MYAALDRLIARGQAQSREECVAKNFQKQAKPINIDRAAGGTISIFTPQALL